MLRGMFLLFQGRKEHDKLLIRKLNFISNTTLDSCSDLIEECQGFLDKEQARMNQRREVDNYYNEFVGGSHYQQQKKLEEFDLNFVDKNTSSCTPKP